MSRIGKKPIQLPSGVTVTVSGLEVTVSGPKGTAELVVSPRVTIAQESDLLRVTPAKTGNQAMADWGLYRQLLQNMVTGATEGFSKQLEVIGVGYRVSQQGQNLVFNLGYSHPIDVSPPEGITLGVQKNTVTVTGLDRALVGQVAANIRSLRPPEPYKGKGIRYTGEHIRRKAGKAGKAAK